MAMKTREDLDVTDAQDPRRARRVRPAHAAAVGLGRPGRAAGVHPGVAGGAAAGRSRGDPGGAHLLLDENLASSKALRDFLLG